MSRLALAAALLLAAPAALAQAVTRPTVSVSAGAMRAVFEGVSITPDGPGESSEARTFYMAALGGEVPVYARGPLTGMRREIVDRAI